MSNGVPSANSGLAESGGARLAQEKNNHANFFNPEAASFFGRLKEKAKNMVYRIYDGMHETPLAYRIIDRFKIAFNNFRIGRHEKKATNLEEKLESIDEHIGRLNLSIASMEQEAINIDERGGTGAAAIRLRIKEIEAQKKAGLDKRDGIGSLLKERENRIGIFVGRREQAANRLIGFYDRKLRPMESELEFLKSKKEELNALIEKEDKNYQTRLEDLERQKEDMRQGLALSGASARAIRTDYVMRFMDDQIKKMRADLAEKKEQWLRKKGAIIEEIARIDRRSNPYRDKREKFARIKDGNLSQDAEMAVPKSMEGTDREKKKREMQDEWLRTAAMIRDGQTDVSRSSDAVQEPKTENEAEKRRKEKWDEWLQLMAEFRKKKESATAGTDEEKFKMARAAAWHTIYNVDSYDELNAENVEDGNQKFLERTQKLWKEIFVHENPDQDAKTCLELLKMAGIDTSGYATAPQKKMREIVKSGVAMDFGDEHGVVAEEEGKLLIIDHHSKKSDRNTSASRFVYEMLIEIGLLQKEEYLDKFIEFTTVCDNLRFSPEEMEQVYKNYSKNLFGLAYRMKPDDVLELFRQGVNPMADLPEDYLASHQYENVAKKDGQGKYAWESLSDLSKYVENKMKRGEAELDRMEKIKSGRKSSAENIKKNAFMVDTGDARFGKVFIDMQKHTGKNKYGNRIEGANHSEQLAVFLRGYDSYLVWSPEQDSFVLFTKRKMDEDSLPGGFSQGFNMRGHMWMKPKDKEGGPEAELKVTLDEIFSKLSGKNDFEGRKKLNIIASIDAGAKALLKMLYEKSLTEEGIKKVVKKVGVIGVEELARSMTAQMTVNKKHKKIDEVFKDKKALLEDTKKNQPEEWEKILVGTLLEYQQDGKR